MYGPWPVPVLLALWLHVCISAISLMSRGEDGLASALQREGHVFGDDVKGFALGAAQGMCLRRKEARLKACCPLLEAFQRLHSGKCTPVGHL